MGDQPDRPVRPLADRAAAASSTSTGSSAARPTSTTRRCTRAPRRSSPTRPPEEGYHLTEDLTDQAIKWMRQQKALMPDKPFFAYFAPGATHAPHHVPEEWSAKYKGKFDQGWDALREETFARQKELGVIPPEARADRAARRDPGVGRHARRPQAGARAPDGGLRRASSSTPTTTSAGSSTRSRTSASSTTRSSTTSSATTARAAEGTLHGTFNELIILNGAGALETPEFMAARIDDFGTPEAYNHYAVGWAHAMDTPVPVDQAGRLALGRHAQRHDRPLAARHRRQGRDPQPVPPRDRRRADGPRGGRPARADDRSTASTQKPIEGVSMRYAFDDADAAERHETQYFEMFCNRGIYHQGWTAVTRHSTPWVMRRAAARSPTTPGSSTTPPPTGARRTTSRPRCRRSSRSCKALFMDRGAQVQRAPARRPPRRALQLRHRRAAGADRAATRSCCSAAWAG